MIWISIKHLTLINFIFVDRRWWNIIGKLTNFEMAMEIEIDKIAINY